MVWSVLYRMLTKSDVDDQDIASSSSSSSSSSGVQLGQSLVSSGSVVSGIPRVTSLPENDDVAIVKLLLMVGVPGCGKTHLTYDEVVLDLTPLLS